MRVASFALKDTFITDIVISNLFRATDANTGGAGSLDLLKLYNESTLPLSSSGVFEISRILIQFDLSAFRALTASNQPLSGTKLNNARFRLKLFDAKHSDIIPSSFNVVVFPLSKSFDEGVGIDNYAFQDIDAANFITASGQAGTAVAWELSGANQAGFYKQASDGLFQ